ncbi:MAG TPA: hypothetical protein VFP64_02910 [Pyrinomonadaceae bacterium]|nr:hypothetical protein [Pyrinomonadaceae bacterium]
MTIKSKTRAAAALKLPQQKIRTPGMGVDRIGVPKNVPLVGLAHGMRLNIWVYYGARAWATLETFKMLGKSPYAT